MILNNTFVRRRLALALILTNVGKKLVNAIICLYFRRSYDSEHYIKASPPPSPVELVSLVVHCPERRKLNEAYRNG